jgi:hypothetical protein
MQRMREDHSRRSRAGLWSSLISQMSARIGIKLVSGGFHFLANGSTY